MDRCLKPAAREADWVQAPGSKSAVAPLKRKPGRPPDSEEKKRLRREEKEAQEEEDRAEAEAKDPYKKKRNEREDHLREALHLLCDEIKETNPEKAERVREILNKEGPSGARKEEADMRRAEKGSQQGVEGSAGGSAGKLTNGRSSKEKAEDQKVERNVLKNEGMVRR